MLSTVKLPDLVIPTGSGISNVLNANKSYNDAECIGIYAPAALDAGTYTIEVNPDPNADNTSSGWVTLQIGDPASDAAPPAAGKARVYYELATLASFRIKCSANAAADRTFKATKSFYA